MKYVIFSASSTIDGFFDTDVDGAALPPNSVQVSDEEWAECLTHPKKYLVVDNKLTISPNWVPVPGESAEGFDWKEVVTAVRGSQLFYKVYEAVKNFKDIERALTVNAPYTVLLACLNSSDPVLDDFKFSLTDLKKAMTGLFTEEDIDEINSILSKANFDFQI